MLKSSLELLIRGLNEAKVRYLVVGGLAVIAHGYHRLTADVDLLVKLDSENLAAALRVLKKLGYRPRVPVALEDFADPKKRESWIRDKHLKAFTLDSPQHPETEVDLFVDDPLGFDGAEARGMAYPLEADLELPVCSLGDLLKLKQAAHRPKDLEDIRNLHLLYPEEPLP